HLYGRTVELGPIMELARLRDVRVIEDAAQAHGARYAGRRVGTLGDAGTFSFYPAKNLGAWGDAGAVVCGDDELAARVRLVRSRRREQLRRFLAERGIATGIYYPIPIHRSEAYRGLATGRDPAPVATRLAGEILSLPIFPAMHADQVERIGEAAHAFFGAPRAGVTAAA